FFAQALFHTQSPPPSLPARVDQVAPVARKARAKTRHTSPLSLIQVISDLSDSPLSVQDGALPPCKRATGRAKSSRNWKWAHAQDDGSDSNKSLKTDDYASYEEEDSDPE
ncbi:Hypothetical predicted protein, partial [Pelobates cultripes]